MLNSTTRLLRPLLASATLLVLLNGYSRQLLKDRWELEGTNKSERLGESLAGDIDINNDGFSDVLVSSPFNTSIITSESLINVYYGRTDGLHTIPDASFSIPYNNPYYGAGVNSAGDVNGDSYDDVFINTYGPDYDDYKGRLFLGSTSGLSSEAAWTSDQVANYTLAYSASAGDINNDGYDDIVSTAFWQDAQEQEHWGFLILSGHSDGIVSNPMQIIELPSPEKYNMYRIQSAGAGDVNSDGYDDLVVGQSHYNVPQSNSQPISKAGKVSVYYGSAAGLKTASPWIMNGTFKDARLGDKVSSAGDINGDGYSDIAVSEPGFGNGLGRLTIYAGSAEGMVSEFLFLMTGLLSNLNRGFPSSISKAGDLDGDGYGDFIAGDVSYTEDYSTYGLILFLFGSSSGIDRNRAVAEYPTQRYMRHGQLVKYAGDVDLDGFSDVLSGAPDFDKSDTNDNVGLATLYYGGALPSSINDWSLYSHSAE